MEPEVRLDLPTMTSCRWSSSSATLVPWLPRTICVTNAIRLTNWGGTPLSYDNNGNLTAFGSSSYTWNARNQLIATADGGGEISYDSFGRRTSRIVSATTTPYLHDGMNPATVSGNLMLDGGGLDETYAQVGSSAVGKPGAGLELLDVRGIVLHACHPGQTQTRRSGRWGARSLSIKN
jgi:YD repeat-containing protein